MQDWHVQRVTGAAAVWGCGCLGVYEGTPYLHSLDLTAAPCIQLAFSLHLGLYRLSPRPHSLLYIITEGVRAGTCII